MIVNSDATTIIIEEITETYSEKNINVYNGSKAILSRHPVVCDTYYKTMVYILRRESVKTI